MLTARRAAGALLLLLAAGAAPLAAQSEAAAIPAPLVIALLAPGFPERSPALTVGAVPADFPAALVPPEMMVLGGMTAGRTITAIFRDTTGRPLAGYESLLQRAGFVRAVATEREGFQSTVGGGIEGWCRDSLEVTPTLRETGSSRLLHVRVSRRWRGMPRCGEARPAPELPRLAALSIPKLTPPAGARMGRAGGGRGYDEVSSEATLTDTTRSAAAIAAHFAGQLSAAGWTARPPVADDRVAAVALEATDEAGKRWQGMLVDLSLRGEHRVRIIMSKPEDR